jgi:hypothetical protein
MDANDQSTDALMSYGGECDFTVVNQCAFPISRVRITHFLKDNTNSEFFIQEAMGVGATAAARFKSWPGQNDNWTVSFERGGGCFMSGKLDKSMQADRSGYKLIIRDNEFVFQFIHGGNVVNADATVKSVYGILG